MYRLPFILFALLFFFSSCQQDLVEEDFSSSLGITIPDELTPYFLTFQREARGYGLTVDYASSNVTAEIQSIDDGNVAGSCTTNGHNLRHIIIDESFWNRASHLLKEMVVYHELGHCILGRGHTEGSFQSGICKSIMRSGLGTCQDAYNTQNRSYFVEELFAVDQ